MLLRQNTMLRMYVRLLAEPVLNLWLNLCYSREGWGILQLPKLAHYQIALGGSEMLWGVQVEACGRLCPHFWSKPKNRTKVARNGRNYASASSFPERKKE